jgi:membrane protein DedA with SNARE-associated domain
MLDSLANWLRGFIESVGYPGLFLLIVLESTMVPIPSLLVMPFAGFLATDAGGNVFSLPVILVINSAAALTGSMISYWIGAYGGKPLLLKYGKWVLVREKDLDRAHAYFERRGSATVLVARFLPVVRHLISIPAGIARMPLAKFLTQTFLGATIWGGGLMIVGYVLGSQWQEVAEKAKRFDLVIAGLIVLAILAIGIRFVVVRRRERSTIRETPAD